jgi:beta-N-acetylhexosaminidase
VALLVLTSLVLGPWWALSRPDRAAEAPIERGDDRTGVALAEATSEPAPSGADGDEAHLDPDDEATVPPACAAAVDALPLRSQLALLLMVGVDGDDPRALAELLAGERRPGGIFVRRGTKVWEDRRLAEPDEQGLPLLVAIDDEGGRVQRLEGILPPLPSAAEMGRLPPEEVEAMAAERAPTMRGLGIDLVFAPVLDLDEGGGIGDRSFGSDPQLVARQAGAYASGLRDGGLLPVVKHFPGEGRASGDPHDGPITAPALDQLRAAELVVYEALLAEGPVGVMVGHLDVPGLTADGVPASLSPDAIGLLRASYEFDGLVVTDDLVDMEAVTERFGIPEAAERALVAGVDLVLLANGTDVPAVLDRLVEAVDGGRLPARRVAGALRRVVATSGCAG